MSGNIGTGEHGLGTGEHRFGEYAWSGVTNTLVNTTNIGSTNWLSNNKLDWSWLTNSLVKTTNIGSTNYIGCRATSGIGQGLPIHWLKQPISSQPIILVVEQPTRLVRGNQCIG